MSAYIKLTVLACVIISLHIGYNHCTNDFTSWCWISSTIFFSTPWTTCFFLKDLALCLCLITIHLLACSTIQSISTPPYKCCHKILSRNLHSLSHFYRTDCLTFKWYLRSRYFPRTSSYLFVLAIKKFN